MKLEVSHTVLVPFHPKELAAPLATLCRRHDRPENLEYPVAVIRLRLAGQHAQGTDKVVEDVCRHTA